MEKTLAADAALADAAPGPVHDALSNTTFVVIAAISFSHLLNDMMQSVLLAIYPMLKQGLGFSFAQIGMITLAFQFTASMLQPLIGLYTDHRPKPWLLPMSGCFTLVGLLLLSQASNFGAVLLAASMVGIGSSIFHPESSRVARMAAGARPGLSQSLFQIGGNLGTALGPLLAALIIVPFGQGSAAWFSLAALTGVVVLSQVARWAAVHVAGFRKRMKAHPGNNLTRRQVIVSLAVLGALMFSKFFYMASLQNYYTFYLMEKFALPLQTAQMYLFGFLLAVAAGTVAGGPVGDRIGRKRVIWASILGVAPFALMLPHVGLMWTVVLSVVIGLILSSAFSAILVYAQELVPGKVGAISGLFFGIAFGLAGIGAALLGRLADATDIATVYQVCAFLPLIGLLTVLLPDIERR
ncbi:MFS transporter [Parazoarcus communis]|uniref:MFS transporter n=1 Tax=Parazoarcus communis TaxID=41977 RepID=A0A2U8GMT1_9RHOO|nr:MFS transporter [Parazoarcus communis]AWI74939.1 MFS transporter [Parazoarcus communis]|tara:strand:- start:95350 stop:96579 length:1230 start_codon:yes stop_codon:yes gene_type:complete